MLTIFIRKPNANVALLCWRRGFLSHFSDFVYFKASLKKGSNFWVTEVLYIPYHKHFSNSRDQNVYQKYAKTLLWHLRFGILLYQNCPSKIIILELITCTASLILIFFLYRICCTVNLLANFKPNFYLSSYSSFT